MSEAPTSRSLAAPSCHRCGASLAHAADQDVPQYCPQCGAPQLFFPEYLRAEEVLKPAAALDSTGKLPPPRPREIDWQPAIVSSLLVAVAGAAFTLFGLRSLLFSYLSFFTLLGGAGIAIAAYVRQRPLAPMNGRIGLRIGAVCGVLMAATLAVSLSSAGFAARFALHRMGTVDAQIAQIVATLEVQAAKQAADASSGLSEADRKQTQEKTVALFHSPEVHAGAAVLYTLVLGVLLVLFSAAGGAFGGMVSTRRPGLRRLL